jgi:hypothetical protein
MWQVDVTSFYESSSERQQIVLLLQISFRYKYLFNWASKDLTKNLDNQCPN